MAAKIAKTGRRKKNKNQQSTDEGNRGGHVWRTDERGRVVDFAAAHRNEEKRAAEADVNPKRDLHAVGQNLQRREQPRQTPR